MPNTIPTISPPRQRYFSNRAVRYAPVSGVCLAVAVGALLALQLASGHADWAPYGAPELMPKAYASKLRPRRSKAQAPTWRARSASPTLWRR